MTDRLLESATQSGFARLVGCSQQAIGKQVSKIGLNDGETNEQWLIKYCNHLREEAAGRNFNSESLSSSLKLRKLQAEVTGLDLDNEERLGNLVVADHGEFLIKSIGTKFVSEMETARTQIIAAVNSKYDIEFDENVVSEPMQSASRSCESHVVKLVESIRETIDKP